MKKKYISEKSDGLKNPILFVNINASTINLSLEVSQYFTETASAPPFFEIFILRLLLKTTAVLREVKISSLFLIKLF
ncbi:MAG: hypothetical protein QW461_03890 [Candidatus Jordarchaeales archaeon]